MRTIEYGERWLWSTLEKKVVPVVLSVILFCSFFPSLAVASGVETSRETTSTSSATKESVRKDKEEQPSDDAASSTYIRYTGEHAQLSVDGKTVNDGGGFKASPSKDLTFSFNEDAGYHVSEVRVRPLGSEDELALVDDLGTYSVAAENLAGRGDLTITAKFKAAQKDSDAKSADAVGNAEPADTATKAADESSLKASKIADQEAVSTSKSAASDSADPATIQITSMSQVASVRAFAVLNKSLAFTVTCMVDGKVYNKEEVLANTIATPPADPGDPAGNKKFTAWYVDGASEPFNFNAPVTESVTLVPHFSDENLVTFMDYDDSFLATVLVKDGATLPSKTPNLPTGMAFSYWSLDQEGTTGRFTGPITGNVTVWPIAHEMTAVIFVTGGPVVASQSTSGRAITPVKPDNAIMVRAGSEFSHWSLTPDGDEYNFDTPLTGTTYLYAVWKPVKVGYVINFWNEKANITGDPGINEGNYEIVYTKTISATDPLAGMSGSTLNTKARPTTGEEGNTITPDIINDRTNYAAGTSILDCSEFAWTNANTETLSADGDTTIDVFAKRSLFTFRFDLNNYYDGTPSPGANASWQFTKTAGSSTWFTPSDFPSEDGTNYYIIAVKLGQDVEGIWPADVKLIDSGTGFLFRIFNGYYSAGTTVISSGGLKELVKKNGYMDADARPTAYEGTLRPGWSKTGAYERRYYYTEVDASTLSDAEKAAATSSADNLGSSLENTPQTSGLVKHTAQNVTRYYRYHSRSLVYTLQNSISAKGAKGWPGKDIPGYVTITSTPIASPDPTRLTDLYQTIGLNKYTYNGLAGAYICYYMPRRAYDLNLVVGEAGTIANAANEGFTGADNSTAYTKSLLYKEPITLPSENPVKPGYVFEGWYLDRYFTQPYVSTEDVNDGIMTYGGLTLYAKFRGTAITVNYHDAYSNDIVASTTYALGEKLREDDLEGTRFENLAIGDRVPGWGTFRGWYFDFDSDGILANVSWGLLLLASPTTDNVYDLYPSFAPDNYKVTFMNRDADGSYSRATTLAKNPIGFHSGKHNTLAWRGYSEKSISTLSRKGYTFTGWNTEKDGSGAEFDTRTDVLGSITVYAQYVKDSDTPDGPSDKPVVPTTHDGSSEETSALQVVDSTPTTVKTKKGSSASSTSSDSTPKTGDTNHLWVGTLFAFMSAATVVVATRRKREHG